MKNLTKKLSRIVLLAAVFFGATSVVAKSAHATWFACMPTDVTEWSNRIALACSNSISLNGNTVRFAAISNANSTLAARFLSLASSAYLSGKAFWVDLPTSSSTNTAGCNSTDCRTPTAFGIGNQ